MRTYLVSGLITVCLMVWMILYSYPNIFAVPAMTVQPADNQVHQVKPSPPPDRKPSSRTSGAPVKTGPIPATNEGAKQPPTPSQVYVVVDTRIPEHLYVYRGTSVILATYCNTGLPGARTPTGVFTIYEKLKNDTMTGTNLAGIRYCDPHVPWVMYFYGGCAIHGFYRTRYGYPQSLGCVELPVGTAAKVYNLVRVGTKVYIK